MKRLLLILSIVAAAFNIANAQWVPVAGTDSVGLNNSYEITSTVVDTFGNVYVSGINSSSANLNPSLFKFNGHAWSTMPLPKSFTSTGGSFFNTPPTLVTDAAGNLYDATTFYDDTISAYRTTISKWNGSSWDLISGLPAQTTITAMSADNYGKIYIGGNANINGATKYFVASWNGSVWQYLDSASTLINNIVDAITLDSLGNLYAGGTLWDTIAHVGYLAKWNGTAWSKVGNLGPWDISSIAISPAGDIYTAGNYLDATFHPFLLKWNGTNWSRLLLDSANYPNHYPIIFDRGGNLFVSSYAKGHIWNGQHWSVADSIANIFNKHGDILFMTKDKTGLVYMSGTSLNAFGHNFVATWDGNIYRNLSTGSTNLTNYNFELYGGSNLQQSIVAADSFGNIYCLTGGDGGTYNGLYVVKWNGTKWDELGTGDYRLNASSIAQLVADPSGIVYVEATYHDSLNNSYPGIAKWDGHSWSWLTNSFPFNPANYISLDQFRNIYVTGLGSNGYGIAKWNGASWSVLGNLHANSIINALGFDGTGNIYASGEFTDTSSVNIGIFGNYYVAKWNGFSWIHLSHLDTFSSYFVNSLATDANGGVYVGGGLSHSNGFPDANAQSWILKWNDTAWVKFGSGFYGELAPPVVSIFVDPANNLYAYGSPTDYYDDTQSDGYAYIYGWNGTSWIQLQNSLRYVDYSGFSMPAPDRYGNFYCVASGGYYTQGLYKYIPQWGACTAPINQEICLVTIDTTTEKPAVVWNKVNKYATDSFYIYRANTPGSNFSQIAIVNPDSLSEWTDTSAFPALMSYRYKISVRDTCGRLEAFSPYHQTIYLSYLGAGQFSWTPYVIEDTASTVTSYALWRDSLGNGNWQLLTSVAGTQTTASDANYASYPNARYMVIVTLPNACTPSRSITSICSNILSNLSTGIATLSSDNIKVVPNPSHDNFTIQTNITGEKVVLISDMLGRVVYEASFGGSTQTINTSAWSNGIYTCQIQQGGQNYQTRLVKE